MSKTEKDKWKSFIKTTLARKRSDRRYKLPIDYIISVADKIHKSNPAKDILINTLTKLFEIAHEHGYQRRLSDRLFFKSKQEKHISSEWNKVKDSIDDEIHSK